MIPLWVGGFSHANDGALHRLDYDPGSGAVAHRDTIAAIANPSFLALHPRGHVLYATSEVSGGKGAPQPPGEVAAFSVDSATGELALIGRRSSMGARPCHVSVDASGRLLFVANYYGGTVAAFAIEADGAIGAPVATIAHQGSSIDPNRQGSPHPHCCVSDPAGRRVWVADLGTDHVVSYELDAAAGCVSPIGEGVRVRPGSGPRHLAFGRDGRFAYLTNEMGGTVTAFAIDPATGHMVTIQEVDALPPGYQDQRWCSEIAVGRSGRVLYAGNRGHNSIAIFAVDPASGLLAPPAHRAAGGRTPRHFALDPAGIRMIVANQDSDALAIFDVDRASGALMPAGGCGNVAHPTCVVFGKGGGVE